MQVAQHSLNGAHHILESRRRHEVIEFGWILLGGGESRLKCLNGCHLYRRTSPDSLPRQNGGNQREDKQQTRHEARPGRGLKPYTLGPGQKYRTRNTNGRDSEQAENLKAHAFGDKDRSSCAGSRLRKWLCTFGIQSGQPTADHA